jgi:hypothetical protein
MGYPKTEEGTNLPAKSDHTSCPVCGEPLFDREVVVCTRCNTPHHDECWHYNKSCATFGCRCLISRSLRPTDDFQSSEGNKDLTLTFRPESPGTAFDYIFIILSSLLVAAGAILEGPVLLTLAGLVSAVGWTFIKTIQSVLTEQQTTVLTMSNEIRISRTLGGRLESHIRTIGKDDILELHLSRYHDTGEKRLVGVPSIYEIHALLTDGSRVQLWRQVKAMPLDETEALAERLAASLDTTIRLLEGDDTPSREAIDALIETHQHSIEASEMESQELLPPSKTD